MKKIFTEFRRLLKKPTNELSILDKLYLVAVTALGLGLLILANEAKEKINERRMEKKHKTN